MAAKSPGALAIDNIEERSIAKISDGRMEKAGKQGALRADDRRNPGRVATRRDRRTLAELGAKVKHNAPQLGRCLRNEAFEKIGFVFVNQSFYFPGKPFDIAGARRDRSIAPFGPTLGAIKGCRRNVRCEE